MVVQFDVLQWSTVQGSPEQLANAGILACEAQLWCCGYSTLASENASCGFESRERPFFASYCISLQLAEITVVVLSGQDAVRWLL